MVRKYRTPSKKIFREIRKACIQTWHTYDNTFGYVTEKLERVYSINNEEANVMFMLNMFHPSLKTHIIHTLSDKAKKYIEYYENIERQKTS